MTVKRSARYNDEPDPDLVYIHDRQYLTLKEEDSLFEAYLTDDTIRVPTPRLIEIGMRQIRNSQEFQDRIARRMPGPKNIGPRTSVYHSMLLPDKDSNNAPN